MTFIKPIIKAEQHFIVSKPLSKPNKPTRDNNKHELRDKFLMNMY